MSRGNQGGETGISRRPRNPGIGSDRSRATMENVPADITRFQVQTNAQASAPAFLSRPEEPELFCHSDQLGERSSLHPMHHLSAMKLDRDQSSPKLRRDLLIQQSRHH
jgi:hypothetical protein